MIQDMDALKDPPFACYLCESPTDRSRHPVFLLRDGEHYWVITGCKQCVRYRIGVEYASAIEKDPVASEDRRKFLSAAARRAANAADTGKEPPRELARHVSTSEHGKQWLEIANEQAAAEIEINERVLQQQEHENAIRESSKLLGQAIAGLSYEGDQTNSIRECLDCFLNQIKLPHDERNMDRLNQCIDDLRKAVPMAWAEVERILKTTGVLTS